MTTFALIEPADRQHRSAAFPQLFMRYLRLRWRLSLIAFFFCCTATIVSVAAAQDTAIKSQHGDWQVVCKPPPPGANNEVCAIVQSVTAEDRKNVGLTVYFQNFSDGTQVLRVFAPVGVLLPPGLGLKIDGKDVGNAPFLRCHTFACYAQVTVEQKLIDQLSGPARRRSSSFFRLKRQVSAYQFLLLDLIKLWQRSINRRPSANFFAGMRRCYR